MPRRTVVVLLVGFLLAGVWLVWESTRPPVPPGPSSRDGAALDPAASAPAAGIDPARTSAPATDAGSGTAAAAPGSVVIRVVRTDGAPALGAAVRVVGVVAYGDTHEREHGPAHTMHDAGGVTVPWRHERVGRVRVTATLGGAFASADIPSSAPDRSVHMLTLAPDVTLRVHVLAADGAPIAGVSVFAKGTHRRADGGDVADAQLARSAAPTGADGVAVLPHARRWLERVAPRGAARPFRVEAMLPGDVSGVLDAAAILPEPIVLRASGTGRIDVVCSAPVAGPLDFVGLLDVAGGTFSLHPRRDEHTVIEHVPFGRRWRIWVPHLVGQSEHDGPTAIEPTRRVQLTPAATAVVCGRVLCDGAPVAGVLSLGALCIVPIPVDPTGTFVVRLMEPRRFDEIRGVFVDERGTYWDVLQPGALDATAGRHDLGDLQCTRPTVRRVFAAGRVETARDLEAVELFVREDFDEFGPRTSRNDATLTVELRPDGTFTVRGDGQGGTPRLEVRSTRHRPCEPLVFREGARNLVVRLVAGIELQLPFRVASREAAVCLEPRLRASDDDDAGREPDQRTWSDDGTLLCTWAGLAPGQYHWALAPESGYASGASPNGAVSVHDAGNGECRAGPIELPPLRVLRLTLPASRAAENGSYKLTDVVRVGGGPSRTIGRADGAHWLVPANEPVDLRVHVAGHRPRTLRGVFADTEVVLERAIAVTLQFDADAAVLGSRRWMTLERRDGDDTWQFVDIRGARFVLELPEPGEWRLSINDVADEPSLVCEPATIVVPESGGTFDVRVRPAPRDR